jgi:hypothetical protein
MSNAGTNVGCHEGIARGCLADIRSGHFDQKDVEIAGSFFSACPASPARDRIMQELEEAWHHVRH